MPATRTYKLNNLIVEWWAEECIHCRKCAISLPEVFNPDRRPWIDLSKADEKDIIEVLSSCPSKAIRLGQ